MRRRPLAQPRCPAPGRAPAHPPRPRLLYNADVRRHAWTLLQAAAWGNQAEADAPEGMERYHIVEKCNNLANQLAGG
ncbi:hypothetical protein [Streptomyces sp. NPDC050856]|uniref:hypothetical protein n=1 Tax=Streptomyces sp. NPDC050856 TaxID=3154939 RepID=UPI0033CE7503